MEIEYSEELGAFKIVFYSQRGFRFVNLSDFLDYTIRNIPKIKYFLDFDLDNDRYAIAAVGSFVSIMTFINKLKHSGFKIEQ